MVKEYTSGLSGSDFERLLAMPECPNLEFKEAKQGVDLDECCKYCVALANEGGGRLVFGVTDKRPRLVCGTRAFLDVHDTARQVYDRTRLQTQWEEIDCQGKRVVVVHIPGRLPGSPVSYKGVHYGRVGSSLMPLSLERLKAIINESEPPWETLPTEVEAVGADTIIKLLDTHKYYTLLNIPYPSTQGEVINELLSKKLISSVKDGFYTITRNAALLLAADLRHFESLSDKMPRIIIYEGKNKIAPVRADVEWTVGYAVGFDMLIDLLSTHLRRESAIVGPLRDEQMLVPLVALREIVANALVHQNLRDTVSRIVISVYQDRVEVTNPGDCGVPIDRIIDHDASANEKLSDWMRRFRICEKRGSGIDRAIDALERSISAAPSFTSGEGMTRVILYGTAEFAKLDKDTRMRACYQHAALRWVSNEPMTNGSLRERFNLPADKTSAVSSVITACLNSGAIKLDDSNGSSRKFARYKPFWA